jgi:hypothetical protein
MILNPAIQVAFTALAIAMGCPPDRVDEAWGVIGGEYPGYSPSDHVDTVRRAIAGLKPEAEVRHDLGA